jgi:hypothetical protein
MSTISPGQYIPVGDVCFPKWKSKLESSHCYASWEINVKQDRQCKYRRSIEARSCKHCCSGKTISITYSECVFVALGTQNAMRMRYIVICGLSGTTVFVHIISQIGRFSKKSYWTQNVCFDFSATFVRSNYHSKKTWARYEQKCVSVFM